MRAQVLSLSSNTTLLRRALPVLVRPYLVRTTSPNHISFLRSTSQATRFPKHDQKLLFTSVSSIRKFTSRATNVNDAGSIDLPIIQSMQQKVFLSFHFIAPYMFDELSLNLFFFFKS